MYEIKQYFKQLLKNNSSFIIFLIIMLFLRMSVFGHYKIPSGSMIPTLKLGDHVIVNKLAYTFGISYLFGETGALIRWAEPKRGDIIVFPSPEKDSNITLIKRVVAIGGDKIKIIDGTLYINDVSVEEKIYTDKEINIDTGENNNTGSEVVYLEKFVNESKAHWMMRQEPFGYTKSTPYENIVPKGFVMCMGDNRDNSKDGRIWGFVDINTIDGKAALLFFSMRENNSFLPSLSFRMDRFFTDFYPKL